MGDRLPTSIQCVVYSYLKLRDHIRVSLVNHSWHAASIHKESMNNGHYTIKIANDVMDIGEEVSNWLKRLYRYRPIGLTLVNLNLFDVDIEQLVMMKDHLRALSVDVHSCKERELLLLTFLTSLTVPEMSVPPMLQQFTKLLHFQSNYFPPEHFIHLPPSLTSLQLTGYESRNIPMMIQLDLFHRLQHVFLRGLSRAAITNDDHWKHIMTSPTLTSIHYIMDYVPIRHLASITMPRLKRISLSQWDRPCDRFMSTLNISAANLTAIDDFHITADRRNLYELQALASFNSLTHLSLTSRIPEALELLPPLAHCLRSLRLICKPSLTYTDLIPFIHLTSLSLALDPFNVVDAVLDPQWRQQLPYHPHLSHITLMDARNYGDVGAIVPFLLSIPPPLSSSSSRGHLRVFYESSKTEWMSGGLKASMIVVRSLDEEVGLFD
jgi:hypothetical protein